ncbi:MAG: hypothetical protein P4L51_00020 [Puia sp.]|nr:hypothetical protein [Puia sp.]
MPKYHGTFRDEKVDACPAFPEGTTTKRAIVAVRIGPEDNASPELEGMIDTGADYTFLPLEFLLCMGINAEDLKTCPVRTPLGWENAPFAWVDIFVANFEMQRVYVGFTNGLNGSLVAILGRGGVLERFKVLFDYPNNSFELEESPHARLN